MILELNISLELAKNKREPLCPQATGLGIFYLLPKMMLIQKDGKGYRK